MTSAPKPAAEDAGVPEDIPTVPPKNAEGASSPSADAADPQVQDTASPNEGSASERGDSDTAGDQVENDLDELALAEGQRDEYLELAQRTRADFDNFRKRAAREASEAERRGTANLARQLVPVIDNLERALAAGGENEATAGLTEGVALVLRQFEETLERAGIETYDPTGEAFDPTWHEALSTVPSEDIESGHVAETLARGYRYGEQVIRAAQVVVSG